MLRLNRVAAASLAASVAVIALVSLASVAQANTFVLGARNSTGTSIRFNFGQSAAGECYAWVQDRPWLLADAGLTQVRLARRLNSRNTSDCDQQKLPLTIVGPPTRGFQGYNADTWKSFGPADVGVLGSPLRPTDSVPGSGSPQWWPSPTGPVCISARQTPGAGGDHSPDVGGVDFSFALPEGTSSAPGGYCASAQSAKRRRPASAVPRVVAPPRWRGRGSSAAPPLLDFLQFASDGCKIVYGKAAAKCAPDPKGNFDGVTVRTSDWNIGNKDLLTSDPVRTQVGVPVTVVNTTSLNVPVTWSQASTTGVSTTNATTTGWKAGAKVSTKVKIPFVGETGVEGSFEWNQSDTASTTVSNQKTETHTYGPAIAQPGQQVSIDVFTNVRKGASTFSGVAQIGSPDRSEPVTTPWFPNLGISPSERQPCIGYLAGDQTVKGSFSWIDQAIQTDGKTHYDDSPEYMFEQSAKSFKVAGRPPCPGFPKYFNSSINFEGSGTASIDSRLREQADVYCTIIATGQKCPAPPSVPPGAAIAQGKLVDGAEGANRQRAVLTGTKASDLLIASSLRPQRLVGLGGGDIIDGDHAGDVLVGGGGADALRAGPGRETLIDSGGSASLIGSTGNDTLISRGGNVLEQGGSANNTLEVDAGHAQAFGGPRRNMFVVRGGRSSLIAGPGRDTFKLLGGHADIVERHHDPRDQLISAISTTMPFGVDRARLIGHRALRLIGNGEGDLIKGNSGNDYLSGGGSGVSRIVAGSGRNTIVVGLEDTVSAGRGADRYVPDGDTGRIRATSIPAPPTPRSRLALNAGLIRNFSGAKGDRIVLQSRRLGLEVHHLARHFRLVQGARPRLKGRRPTLVYYKRSHLLAYAVNGAGGYPLRPLAILRGVRKLKRSDFVIR